MIDYISFIFVCINRVENVEMGILGINVLVVADLL